MPVSDAEIRSAQRGLVKLAIRDLGKFWASLDTSRPEFARDALLAFLPDLVNTYGDQAAAAAAEWYDTVREQQGVSGSFRARMAESVPPERVEARVRSAAGHLWTGQAEQTYGGLAYSLSKYVLEPARETIAQSSMADPQSVGWRRVAHSNCKFCRMLMGNGGVYKESTVLFASHGDCNCTAVPEWDSDAPEVDVRLYEMSKRRDRMTDDQIAAQRKRVRDWLESHP